ncbi:MAG TPA: MFS transporter [Actinocrinis sp.]|uniref:MFS transporter n=1 Tax=Actinocrinis sp. TaxID=1920516 RepID=UPI002DDCA478|nr:MFS transporter [Actinocrinis sp.]HEV2343271.1 MFS transporter [Actinocrinis sp.]
MADTREAAETGTEFVWTRKDVIVLVVLCLAPLLEYIDITVVNVALPTIRTDLGFALPDLQWVVNGYMVTYGGFFLLAGRTGDLLGRRRVLMTGVAVFTLASLLSGLSTSPGLLITARAVQGTAAAFVVPLTLAMIASSFPEGKARNLAVTAWGSVAAISSALGLLIGGPLVSGPGWRWIFFVNIPVGVVVVAASWRYLRTDPPAQRRRKFDAVAAVTSTAGLSLLIYALVQTSTHAWGSGRTIGLLAVAAVLLGYFVVHENAVARDPLLPFSLFRNRAVSGANAASAMSGAALVSVFYFVTLYEQQVLHYSALKTGLAYLPLTGMFMVLAGAGPVLIPKIGIRYVTAIGALVAGVGVALLTRVSPNGTLGGTVILPTMVFGAGLAIFYIPMTIAAVYKVDSARTGVASALVNVTRTVGGAIGLAIVSTAVTSRVTHLAGTGHSSADALSGGFRLAFAITAGLLGATAVIAIVLFRNEGRGEKVDLTRVAQAGMEG